MAPTGRGERVFRVLARARPTSSARTSDLSAAIDLDPLGPVPGAIVRSDMRQRHSDLLFRAPLVVDGEYLVYLLLEHQSEPHPHMPLRILEYLVQIWTWWLRQPGAETTELPPIVPLVLHHGPRGWRAARSLHALIPALDVVPALRPFLPSLELLIDDLGTVSDDELIRRSDDPLSRAVFFVLRDARSPERLARKLTLWGPAAATLLGGPRAEEVSFIMRYLLMVAQDEDLPRRIIDVAPPMEVAVGSAAEMWIKEGEAKGFAKGEAKVILQLVEERFGPLDDEQRAQLREREPSVAAILAAGSLADLLADE